MATASSPHASCPLGCSVPMADIEAPACSSLQATSCGTASSQERRWYSVLAELQSTDDPSAAHEAAVEFVARLLREALQCVACDDQWNCSGIAQMLERALEMSERGCVESARKAAVGLLDFHKMVEKYRQVVASRTKSSSSSGKRHGSDELDSDISEDACGPLKKQRTSGVEEMASAPEDAAVTSSDQQRASQFAVPHLPAKKTSPSTSHSQSTAPVRVPATPPSVVWTGSIWQNVPNGRDLVYCKVSVPLPPYCAKELAESQHLEVAQLAPRRGVKLGRHRVCKCTIVEASTAQLAKLKSMAQNELVALAPLETHGLILVPYLDNSGNVRLVCFCLGL